jgi:CRP-like cAMP-binding protein
MIGPMERALFFKSLDPFQDATAAEIAVFAENARERTFRAGDVLLERGRRVPAFHAILDGTVRAVGGEYLDGAEVGARQPLGLLSLLARREAGLHAVAQEDVTTLVFTEDVFLDLLEDRFGVLLRLIGRLAARTLEVRQQVPDGAYLAPMDDTFEIRGDRLDLVERLLLIRRPGSPFASASMEAMARLAAVTPIELFEAGETIWKPGDRSTHALILVRGVVACTTQWGFSRFRAGPGYPLGNLERFSGDPRWFTAVAETPVMAIHSKTEELFDIMEDHPDMALALARSMAERVIAIREEQAEEQGSVGVSAA